MRIPYSLLQRCLSSHLTPQEIHKALTGVGIEVDAIILCEPSFEGIVVGRVVETTIHPHADRLRCAKVDVGHGVVDLVCGAANCRPGILVACAKEGAVLGKGDQSFRITKTTIRDVESHGMLCSEKELGFGSCHEGILELDESFFVGQDLKQRFSDVIFELSLTPNLGYCLSVEGIAKEVCRATGLSFIPWKTASFVSSKQQTYSIIIKDPSLCPRYGYAVFDHVSIKESPIEQRILLDRCGYTSINGVVDAANLVMLILGHPLHCFDKDKLPRNEIDVRESQKGESLVLLDARTIGLPPHSLLIASGNTPLALAGVMGGQSTAISKMTTSLFVESAFFNPKAVRRTRKATETSTEASRRFERGVDPNGIERALMCFKEFLFKESPAAVLREQGVVGKHVPDRAILIRESAVRSLLGISVSLDEIEQALVRTGLHCVPHESSSFLVHIPSARHDLLEEADLIEEVIKTLGYERVTSDPTPSAYVQSSLQDHFLYESSSWARTFCIRLGLQEWVTCDLIGPEDVKELTIDLIAPQDLVHLANPLTTEQSLLRPSLFSGMVASFAHNYAYQEKDCKAFEVGTVYLKHGGKYIERLVVGVLLAGNTQPAHFTDISKEVDFFNIKGIVESFASALQIESLDMRKSNLNVFHPYRQAVITLAQHQIGIFGQIHPALLKKKGISQNVFFLELDLQELFAAANRHPVRTLPLWQYPAMERDWTISLPCTVSYQTLMEAIRARSIPKLESVSLLSVFMNEKLGKNLKNVTLRFRFRDQEKTLLQEQVDGWFCILTQEVLHSLGLENNNASRA